MPPPPSALPTSKPNGSGDDCTDSDNGALDPYGDGCDEYATSPSWCGNYDDADFSSNTMCCTCGGGSTAAHYQVLLTTGATCAAGTEITSTADCEAAIAEANAAIGKAGSGTVSSVSSSFQPKGCFSSCYSDSTGYSCGVFR